jgi:arsenate reductase
MRSADGSKHALHVERTRPRHLITSCDNTAGEGCPNWPGQPMTAHWEIPESASVQGTEIEKRAAFRGAFNAMDTRIKLFLSLPLASIDSIRLKERMDVIGKTDDKQQS